MPEVTQYAPGAPSWVDLASPDPDGSARFYGELFGWEVVETGPVEETGGYRMLRLGGRDVAGLGPVQAEGQPAMWTTYVNVDDAEAVVQRAREAGGHVMLEPFDVFDAGRMAVLVDAVGALVAIWQPKRHLGSGVTGRPGSTAWFELACRDTDAARGFYEPVFGWSGETTPGESPGYTVWKLGDERIGGMVGMTEEWPPEVPSHWMVYFAVDDVDAAATRAKELGGSVPVPPTDIPLGRFAVLNDPHGSVFSILRRAPETAVAASAPDEGGESGDGGEPAGRAGS